MVAGLNKLYFWRKKIDRIDSRILRLLEKRQGICVKIGKWKKSKGIPIRDKKREAEIIKNKCSKTKLERKFVTRLYRLIIEHCVSRER
jgi:chorismate mutase